MNDNIHGIYPIKKTNQDCRDVGSK